jgi:hypothetical protein
MALGWGQRGKEKGCRLAEKLATRYLGSKTR